jgi:hypothetical protein
MLQFMGHAITGGGMVVEPEATAVKARGVAMITGATPSLDLLQREVPEVLVSARGKRTKTVDVDVGKGKTAPSVVRKGSRHKGLATNMHTLEKGQHRAAERNLETIMEGSGHTKR